MKRRFFMSISILFVAAFLMIPRMTMSLRAAEGKLRGITDQTYQKTFIRHPVKLLTIEEIMKKWPPKAGQSPAPEAPKAGEKAVPGIYIDDGKYVPAESDKDIVKSGTVGDTSADGVTIKGDGGNLGGVYVTGGGPAYTLSNADIELTGDVKDMGGVTAGAAAEDHGTLVLKNVNITVTGKGRNTVSSTKNSTLRVYNSTLIDHGAPFKLLPLDDPSLSGASKYLEVQGNSRTTITMQDSYSYFYDSTIIGDGWGALSTDAGGDFVYMEANNCKVRTIKSGYGAYADLVCHDTFNDCDFDVASMAIVVAGVGEATFNNTQARCGSYFALMHCVTGSYTEIGTLKVTDGEIHCKKPAVMIRSHNADISFDSVKLTTDSGILIQSMVNPDPNATPTEGKTVYGIHAVFKNMEAKGDIIHEDPARIMSVDLESATLTGAVNGAYLMMDAGSRWTATADSKVTLVGEIDLSRIDAPKGVTITAVGSESGTYTLPGGGVLIMKAI